MKTDDLIDDVARRMTAVERRPGMRVRVLSGIDGGPRERRQVWFVPAAVASAAACAALVWFAWPSAPVTSVAETTVAERVASAAAARAGGTVAEVTERTIETPVVRPDVPARPSVDAPSPVVARAATTAALEAVSWEPPPLAEIHSLPPLAGPPPIVIEPIGWSEVTIVPLHVALIEVKALVIEPIAIVRLDGV